MLSHERIWAGIDKLASAHDLTPSGLAKRAGLDSTTFNKSKRIAGDGRARWPSTESLSKVLAVTGVSLNEFMAMIDGDSISGDFSQYKVRGEVPLGAFMETGNSFSGYNPVVNSVPVIGMAQAGSGGFFDDAGFPIGEGWDQIEFPTGTVQADALYALEVTGDSMLPLYREGDRIIISPSAKVQPGDRIVAKLRSGEVMAKILKRRTSLIVSLASANPDHEDREIQTGEIEWMARILWASQ